MMKALTLWPVPGIPQVKPGDDLAGLIGQALDDAGIGLQPGDLLAVAQKIVSKAEGRMVNLATVVPDERARQVAAQCEKDPRLVALILQESSEISRLRPGLIIVRHRLGFTCANAGIDRSNVPQAEGEETVLLLPQDPDGSAAALRQKLGERAGHAPGVVITDSHGRPFRLGTVGVALGVAGLPALWDRRGDPDLFGYRLQHTEVGLADEIAAAAGLLMGQAAESIPVVLIRGLRLPPGEGRAADLVRPPQYDLYR